MAGIGAIVLAAGKGERMGRPKVLVDYEGKTFLEHALASLKGTEADRIVVVLDPASPDFAAAKKIATDGGAQVVENPKPERGMLSSVKHGLAALAGATHAALMLIDHPGLKKDTLDALFLTARSKPDHIVVPTYQGKRGHPGIFPAKLFGDLMGAPADEGARAVLHAHAALVLEVAIDDPALVRNFDTPEDLPSTD